MQKISTVWEGFKEKSPGLAQWVRECGLFVIVCNLITVFKYLLLQFLPQALWYFCAFIAVTCIVNSINCIWVAVADNYVPSWVYNIGTTLLNGGVSMVIFFVVNKIIFPAGETSK